MSEGVGKLSAEQKAQIAKLKEEATKNWTKLHVKDPKSSLLWYPLFLFRFVLTFGFIMLYAGVGSLIYLCLFWWMSERMLTLIIVRACGLIFSYIVWVLEWLDGAKVEFYGDDIPDYESAVVIGNHLVGIDYALFMALAYRKGMIGNVRMMAKEEINYIPFVGTGMRIIGTIFLKRKFENDEKSIHDSFEFLGRLKLPTWIVSHPEGTRIAPEKLAMSQFFAQQRHIKGLEHSRHVMVPRVKGLITTIRYLNKFCPHIKYLYDFTMVHTEGIITAWSYYFHRLPGKVVKVHVRKFKISDLPLDDEEKLKEWIYNLYAEKEVILQQMEDGGKPFNFVGAPKRDMPFTLLPKEWMGEAFEITRKCYDDKKQK